MIIGSTVYFLDSPIKCKIEWILGKIVLISYEGGMTYTHVNNLKQK